MPAPTFSPEQQQWIAAFNQRHPGFDVQSVNDLRHRAQADPQGIADYLILANRLGLSDNGPYKNFFLNPVTGQVREEMSGTKAALLGGLGAAAVIGTAGLAAPYLGGGGAAAAETLPEIAATSSPATGLSAPGVTGALAGGGAGQNVLGTLGKYGSEIGDLASGAASGLSAGRRYDAQLNAQNAARNNAALVDIGTFNLQAPAARTNQVARGEVLQTMQDAPLTGDPRIDKFAGGGLRPSAFGQNSRQAGGELSREALAALLHGTDQITPQLATPSRAGTGENVLAGVGLGTSILGALKKWGRR